MTQRLRRNLRQMKTRNQWKSLLNFPLPTLTPTRSRREACRKTMSINSNNFLMIKSYLNCAATPVWSWKKKDNSSLHLMKKDRTKWRIHVESTRYLKASQNPDRECGFSEIRRPARSWMWRSAFIKHVTVLKNSFLGSNCDRNSPIRYRIVRNHCPWNLWAQSDGETCCEGKATTEACCNTVSYFHSYSWKKIDRHWNATIRSKVLCIIKSNDQITATWCISSSRRWWSSTIWRNYGRIQGKVRWLFAMASWWLDNLLGKRRRTKENWTLTLPYYSCTSERFRDILETISLILHCKTMHCCRRTSPSTSTTSEMKVKYIQSSTVDWSRRKKSQKGKAIRVFHCSKPYWRWPKHGRNSMQLGQTKNRTIQKYLETSSKHSVLVQFKARSEERIAVWSKTITRAIVLYNTLLAICIEKAVCMTTNVELYYRVCQPKNFPRTLLKPNPQSGRQDRPDQEARESSDHQSVSGSYGETRSGNVDYRIPGIPHSTYSPTTGHESQWNGQTVDSAVRESPAQGVFPAGVETDRKDKCVQREVEEVDHRHEQYGDLRALRNLFQETTPRLCFKLWNWCGRSLKPRKGPNSSTRRTMTPYQFPVMASKRTSSMVPNMDLPNGNDCTTKPRRCCRELANPSMVGTKQFWKDGTRMTITQVLSDIGWTEE